MDKPYIENPPNKTPLSGSDSELDLDTFPDCVNLKKKTGLKTQHEEEIVLSDEEWELEVLEEYEDIVLQEQMNFKSCDKQSKGDKDNNQDVTKAATRKSFVLEESNNNFKKFKSDQELKGDKQKNQDFIKAATEQSLLFKETNNLEFPKKKINTIQNEPPVPLINLDDVKNVIEKTKNITLIRARVQVICDQLEMLNKKNKAKCFRRILTIIQSYANNQNHA